MHHPTDRMAHTTAFVTPVVEHWLEIGSNWSSWLKAGPACKTTKPFSLSPTSNWVTIITNILSYTDSPASSSVECVPMAGVCYSSLL